MTRGVSHFNLRNVLFLLALSFPLAASASEQGLRGREPVLVPGVVTRIVDGDTVRFRPDTAAQGQKDWAIRMLAIDAPEQHLPVPGQGMRGQKPWGDKATDYLAKILPVGSHVTLVHFGRDKYHRVLGRIDLNGVDINLEMVREGQAVPYLICEGDDCNEKFFSQQSVAAYVEACEQAKEGGRGIFDHARPLTELPYLFRLRMMRRNADKYVGDLTTHRLYAPSQVEKVADPCQRLFFYDEQLAKKLGFVPVSE